MKYLKRFENNTFNVGEYVIIDREGIFSDMSSNGVIDKKIPSDDDVAVIINIYSDEIYSHVMLFSNGEDIVVKKDEILRNATDLEISEYNIKKDSNKYNL